MCNDNVHFEEGMKEFKILSRAYVISTNENFYSPTRTYQKSCEEQLKRKVVSKISQILQPRTTCTPEMIIRLNRGGQLKISGDYACYADKAKNAMMDIAADVLLDVSDSFRSDIALVYKRRGVDYRILQIYGRTVFARHSKISNYYMSSAERKGKVALR